MGELNTSLAFDYSVESGAGIFEPDVILPSQFLDRDGVGIDGGERRLMAALLSDGIEAYIAQALVYQSALAMGAYAERGDACEWVETKDYSYVFSFDVVCDCLGINADYLRLGLARYVESVRERQEQARAAGNGASQPRAWKKIRRPRKPV